MKKVVDIPEELLWDYREPPDDILWRLQRLADFFPSYGTDKETVEILYQFRDRLKIEEGKYRLIGIYKEVWDEESRKRNKRQNP